MQCETSIVEIQLNGIVIKLQPSIMPNTEYTLCYRFGSMPYDMENHALNYINSEGSELLQYLFPCPLAALEHASTPTPVRQLQWQNNDILENAEQMQAVREIVHRSMYSPTIAPYLLFGPPGTGKTKTLIETVYQVLQANSGARILLCTSSNAAADELMVRLMRVFPHNQSPFDHGVYRVLKRQLTDASPDHWRSSGNETFAALLGGSNYCQRAPPSAEMLSRYSVIVCTLSMGGMLAKSDEGCQFTDIFIDECGSATETAALVALQRGCTGGRMMANVVLAGDPKQLGPVLKSTDALRIGYGKLLSNCTRCHCFRNTIFFYKPY